MITAAEAVAEREEAIRRRDDIIRMQDDLIAQLMDALGQFDAFEKEFMQIEEAEKKVRTVEALQ